MGDEQGSINVESMWAGSDDMLARYGDVPVAYAVFRVKLNDEATKVVDTEYVYANAQYCKWVGLEEPELIGHSFLETVEGATDVWFPYCYRAAVLHEGVQDTVYSSEIDSWLLFNVEPTPMEGCCIFAFTHVDVEHQEREVIELERDTSDLIIDIAGALSGELSYDDAMNGLLESMSGIIHPERLYIFERWEHTSDNTFEWCAPGVEPQIDMLQNLDNSEFDTWDRMLATDSVVVIPDVSAYKGVDDRLYELLSMQGIDRLLAVPFYDRGELIGYLGADNYALVERLDTHRLLETVASFVRARMVNRRLMDELERVSSHDSLTSLLNRRGVDAEIARFMAENKGEPFLLILMDIDDFKSINDQYGHAVGDEALRALADRLRQIMPDDAVIGRNGGDEILVMLHGDSAKGVDDYLDKLVGEDLSYEWDGKRYSITVSVGYSWCNGLEADLPSAYSRADVALYTIKYNGKSGYCCFNPDMDDPYQLQYGFAPRNVTENLPEPVVVYQMETGKILFANDEMVKLAGCEDLHGFMAYCQSSFVELVHPDDRQRVSDAFETQSDSNVRLQFRVLDKDGNEREVAFGGRRKEMGNGTSAVYAMLFQLD